MNRGPGHARKPRGARIRLRAGLLLVVSALLAALAPVTTPVAEAQPTERIDITVSTVTPQLLRSDSSNTLTISGTIHNTSDSTLRDLEMRLQRGKARATRASVLKALRDRASTAVVRTRFEPVATRLAAGARTGFELRVTLSGADSRSLRVDSPGIYPLLLNVNGELPSQRRARLGSTRFMLPVLSLPGGSPAAPSESTPVTTLIPLIDYPRMIQQRLPGRPTILTDDRLARSLAPGGRLHGLVRAVSEEVPPDEPLGKGLCFAIDPDLIVTAKAMAEGYRVRRDNGDTVRGTGSEAARTWLDDLRSVTQDRCVISMPYSDTDVVALGRAELPELIENSLDGADAVSEELGVEVREDVLWPVDGALDEPAASQLADTAVNKVLLHPDSLASTDGSLRPARLSTANSDYTPSARLIDPLVADALNPMRGQSAANSTQLSPPGDATPALLDGLASLTFRSRNAAVPGTTLIAPPRRWNPNEGELRDFLSGLRTLRDAGFVRPTALPEPGDGSAERGAAGTREQSAGSATRQVALAYPASSAADEIPQRVLDELAAQNRKVGRFYRAAAREPAKNVDPASVTTPLRNGLLRGASSAWRGESGTARKWLETAERTLRGILGSVRLGDPKPISLTSSNGKLPVTVVNDLPVTIWFELHVDSPRGVSVDDLGRLKVPANGKRQFLPKLHAERAGKFTVDVTMRTEGGTKLGRTQRIRVNSNAYGTVSLIITISGAALLVLLSGRRIVRRIRGRNGTTTPNGPTGTAAEQPGPNGSEPPDTPPNSPETKNANETAETPLGSADDTRTDGAADRPTTENDPQQS
ncbi:hypothetical protein SAMN04487904_106207 [Actinopolyspora lacussalsi subsp. righensis]|uniref:Glycoprotein n=1 Tax=Actinopolyspora righensis TaxID=995060 RepID=A0A1I7AAT1_9ACTN|nr:DUF6049 family protein [Actinopolyspora righensis]SFT72028.1 hypothetical protein SAMN04487904_106207 [Actinopolyspora righensis]